jgi:branched-chain amino acid transport system permease protein
MPADQGYGKPSFIEDWCLASVVETIILILLSPAMFIRGQSAVGIVMLAAAVLLLVATAAWWTRQRFGYHLLVLLYAISVIALLGAGIAFLLAQPWLWALILVLLAYLAALFFAKGRRGWGYVLIAVLIIIAVILLASRPAGTWASLLLTLYLFAIYLFSGGAAGFYFGHSMAELSSHEVLTFFGFAEVPITRRILDTAMSYLGRVLNLTFSLFDLPAKLIGAGAKATTAAPSRRGRMAAAPSKARRLVLAGLIVIGLLLLPFGVRVFEQQTALSLLITLNVGLLFVVLALGLNIVVGFAGLLDLGYAAFFAIGAYTLGVFTWPNLRMEWSFWIVIWISAVISAIFGMIIGTPTLRLRGDYLAIVTLAFGEIVPRLIRELWDINIAFTARFIILLVALLIALLAMVPLRTWLALSRIDREGKGGTSPLQTVGAIVAFILIFVVLWQGGNAVLNAVGLTEQRWVLVEHFNLTNGPQGMNPVGRPQIFGHEVGIDPLVLPWFTISPPMQWSYLIMVIGAVVIFAASRLENSRLGRAWMAIREDETAADAMGVDPIRTKILAFALGASFSGFAGSIYGGMIQAIFPELFSFLVSVFLIIIVIVSGMGNIWGVLMGGLIIAVFDRVILAQIVPQYVPGGDVLQRWRWVMYASGLIAMMVLRPEGLFPSRARQAELHESEEAPTAALEEQLAEGS